MLQRRGVDADGRIAALVEHTVRVEHAAAVDRAAIPVETAVDVRTGTTGDVQRAVAAQVERRRDAYAIAQYQRPAAVRQRAGAVEQATRCNRGRAPEHLQEGTGRNVLRAGQADRVAQRQAARFDIERAALHEGHRAEVADVGTPGTHLGQRAGVLEAAAERTGVLIDVEDAVRCFDRQRQRTGIAQQRTVLEVEAAARRIGDAAVAAAVRMHQRGLAQIDRCIAGLIEHACQRQHATAGNRTAAPRQVARHGGIAGDVQRTARQVDAGCAAGHIQVDRSGVDVQRGQAEVGIDVGDVARDAQR